jgi:hypothetical protein
MRAGDVRSALIVSCADGPDRRTAHLQPPAQRAFELARLLRDPALGGFEVSLLVAPTAPALQAELTRFLADRAPQDTVVVHLAGRLVADADGEHHLCGADGAGQPPGADGDREPPGVDGVALAFIEDEVGRCRSERLVLLLDCPAEEPATSGHHGGTGAGPAFPERLRGPGRSVHLASTEAVIDLVRQEPLLHEPGPVTGLRALLVRRAATPTAPTRGLLAAVSTAVAAALFLTSIAIIGAGGPVGMAAAAAAVVVVVAPIFRRATREGWGLPPDDTVLGDGVPFYCLYMLRRSQKSRDWFRHH